jgi:putative FmdB family regulatory protein
MPIYEYSCHRCGQKFEVRQKFADEPLKVHEACGGEAERLISAPIFHFKGTGWYVTDYAKNGKSSSAGSNGHDSKSEGHDSKGEGHDSKSETKAETKSESKTDVKPPAKAEPSPAAAKT